MSEQLDPEINRLLAEGDQFLDEDRFEDALSRYDAAWNLLPEPRTDWTAAAVVLAAIGDAHFFAGDFAAGRQAFMTVMRCDGATGNPYLRMRLGQCLFEMGDVQEALQWLTGAYLLDGTAVFAKEDPKYLNIIKPQLEPPPGGWPEGW